MEKESIAGSSNNGMYTPGSSQLSKGYASIDSFGDPEPDPQFPYVLS